MQILKPHFKNYRKEIILAIITILISAFATLWQPRLLENIQKAILADNQSVVLRDGIGLVVLGLLAIIAGIFNVYYAAKIAQGITSDLREETYAKIQSFSFGNIEKFSSGSLVVRLINDMNQVMNMMMILFMQLLRMPIILIGSFVLSIITIPQYWWAPVLMLALMIGVGYIVIQNMNKLFAKFQHYMDKISTRVKENLQGVRVVKSFNQGENEIKRFNETSDDLNELNIKIGYCISTIMPAFMLIAYLVIAEKFYFHGLVGNLFGGGALKSSKILSEKQYSSKLFKSYIGKEFKILYRNHIFLIQCLLPAIFIPIIMLVVTLPSFNNGNMELTELVNQLGNFNINSLLVCSIILGLIQFFSMFIYISITAISRDGNNANFIKYIPVSLYKQYIYKIVLNVIMNIVTIIITLFLAWFIFKLPIITLIVLFIVATIIAIFQSILMIIIDLKRPKLNWDFEYAVVKQNLNLVFPMLLGLLNILVIALIVLLFKNINVYLGLIIIGIIFLIFTIIVNNYLYKNQFKLAEKII